MDDSTAEHEHSLLIDQLGGTVATATLAEVTPAAVSQWRRTGIPKARLMFLRLARPEIFAAPIDGDAA